MTNPDGSRLYNNREIGALVQRATELQESAARSDERGTSLEEVEQIASEIGIALEHLRAAASEMEDRREPEGAFTLWGGPFFLHQKRLVSGGLTDDQWEQIVMELRRLTGSAGTVSEIGQTREWTRVVKDMDFTIEQTQVAVRPRADQTVIEIRKQYRGGAIMAYVIAVLLSGATAGAVLDGGGLSDLMNSAILIASGTGGLAVARISIAGWTRRQRQQLKDLAARLHDSLQRSAASALAVGAPPPEGAGPEAPAHPAAAGAAVVEPDLRS